jgi:hypothetical protein
MASSVFFIPELKYCLVHGKEVLTRLLQGSECHPGNVELEEGYCHGPFAEAPPPPALTEEEWDLILEKEYYRYAS